MSDSFWALRIAGMALVLLGSLCKVAHADQFIPHRITDISGTGFQGHVGVEAGKARLYPAIETDGLVFFQGQTREMTRELWCTDGTPEGTIKLRTMEVDLETEAWGPGSSSAIEFHQRHWGAALGSRLVFAAKVDPTTSNHYRIFVSDGTINGTQPISSSLYEFGEDTRFLMEYNGEVYFVGSETPDQPQTLWKTNGTLVGTVRVQPAGSADIVQPAMDTEYTVAAGLLWFTGHRVDDGVNAPNNLWRTDGSAAGTFEMTTRTPLPSICQPTYCPTPSIVPMEYDCSNALTESEQPERIFDGNQVKVSDLAAVGDRLYFVTEYLPVGIDKPYAVWESDGTPEGTVRRTCFANEPYRIWWKDGDLYFLISDQHDESIWRLPEGSTTGEYLPSQLLPGTAAGAVGLVTFLGSTDTHCFFSQHVQVAIDEYEEYLWSFEDGEVGAQFLTSLPSRPYGAKGPWTTTDANYRYRASIVLDGRLYLGVRPGPHGSIGHELWVSDGTAGNTEAKITLRPFHDFILGSTPNGIIYDRWDDTTGFEPWVYSIGSGNMLPLGDFFERPTNAIAPSRFESTNSRVYFSGVDGQDDVSGDEASRYLFSSDGTISGTSEFIPQLTGEASSALTGLEQFDVQMIGDTMYFIGETATRAGLFRLLSEQDSTVEMVVEAAGIAGSSSLVKLPNGQLLFTEELDGESGVRCVFFDPSSDAVTRLEATDGEFIGASNSHAYFVYGIVITRNPWVAENHYRQFNFATSTWEDLSDFVLPSTSEMNPKFYFVGNTVYIEQAGDLYRFLEPSRTLQLIDAGFDFSANSESVVQVATDRLYYTHQEKLGVWMIANNSSAPVQVDDRVVPNGPGHQCGELSFVGTDAKHVYWLEKVNSLEAEQCEQGVVSEGLTLWAASKSSNSSRKLHTFPLSDKRLDATGHGVAYEGRYYVAVEQQDEAYRHHHVLLSTDATAEGTRVEFESDSWQGDTWTFPTFGLIDMAIAADQFFFVASTQEQGGQVYVLARDSNVNGVPDAEELVDHDSDGLGDLLDYDDDNDGYCDSQEIEAHTDPLDHLSTPSGEPLCVAQTHSADVNANDHIELSELLRVIQYYNLQGISCSDPKGATEDGFVAMPNGSHACAPHASDYAPQNWKIELNELLRLVQFYNAGGLSVCAEGSGEDSFCPVRR